MKGQNVETAVPSCPTRLIMHWIEEGTRARLSVFTVLMSSKWCIFLGRQSVMSD